MRLPRLTKKKPPRYDVLVKAVAPRKVVTVARFGSLAAAQACVSGMTEIGFEAIISWKERAA